MAGALDPGKEVLPAIGVAPATARTVTGTLRDLLVLLCVNRYCNEEHWEVLGALLEYDRAAGLVETDDSKGATKLVRVERLWTEGFGWKGNDGDFGATLHTLCLVKQSVVTSQHVNMCASASELGTGILRVHHSLHCLLRMRDKLRPAHLVVLHTLEAVDDTSEAIRNYLDAIGLQETTLVHIPLRAAVSSFERTTIFPVSSHSVSRLYNATPTSLFSGVCTFPNVVTIVLLSPAFFAGMMSGRDRTR